MNIKIVNKIRKVLTYTRRGPFSGTGDNSSAPTKGNKLRFRNLVSGIVVSGFLLAAAPAFSATKPAPKKRVPDCPARNPITGSCPVIADTVILGPVLDMVIGSLTLVWGS
jgi:hypothetical protein